MEYIFGTREYEEDILDFANLVFSQAYRPHDFKRLLPKVYAREGFAPLHALAIDENKRIRGMAALLEGKMSFRGESLSFGYVGTVSVHPYARGEGHMKKLLPLLCERARQKNLDFMVLSGNRQRYQYFGFENALCEMSFSITSDNVRHALKDIDGSEFSFKEMTEGDSGFAKKLYLNLENRGRPVFDREIFLEQLRSWDRLPYMVYRGNESFGYIVSDVSGNIYESVLLDDGCILKVLKAWHSAKLSGFKFFPSDETQKVLAGEIAQAYEIRHSQMIRVLSFERLLRFLIKYRLCKEPCFDFESVISLAGERLEVKAKGGKASVSATDKDCNIFLSHDEAVRTLFEPYAERSHIPLGLRQLLPLEMYFPATDSF